MMWQHSKEGENKMDDTGDPRERNLTENDIAKKKDMILDDIVKLVVQELDISPTEITPDMSIEDDLTFDSLQIYELVVDLEEAYDIRLPDDMLDSIVTVGDFVDLVYTLTTEERS